MKYKCYFNENKLVFSNETSQSNNMAGKNCNDTKNYNREGKQAIPVTGRGGP
jgi:hypothetical protein